MHDQSSNDSLALRVTEKDELAILYHALRELSLSSWREVGTSDIRLLFRIANSPKSKKTYDSKSTDLGHFFIQLAHLSYACKQEDLFIAKAQNLKPPAIFFEQLFLITGNQTNLAYHVKTKGLEKLVALGPFIKDGFFSRLVSAKNEIQKIAK